MKRIVRIWRRALGHCLLAMLISIIFLATFSKPAKAQSSDAYTEDAMFLCLREQFKTIERDITDHTRAFDPSTGKNFFYDKSKHAWMDGKTGESLCPKTSSGPALEDAFFLCLREQFGTLERDFTDHTRAFDPNTGRNFFYDKDKHAWIDSKTGECICPKCATPTVTTRVPPGETANGGIGKIIFQISGVTHRVTWTSKCVYESTYDLTLKTWSVPYNVYCAPTDFQIIDVLRIVKGDFVNKYVVLSDGSVIDLFSSTSLGKINLGLYESPKKLIGDALYMLTTQNIFVSRDTARTWTLDTAGLGGSAQGIAIDSQQFVYAITNNGLFRQDPDKNIWNAMTTLPKNSNPNKIFIDRLNRIYLGGYNGLFRSLDRGTTWTRDTSGMGLQGFTAFGYDGFGDDAYGNVYAITQDPQTLAHKLFRSNGTKWVRIDGSLSTLNIDSLSVKQPFTSIGGDSILLLTSKYGVFSSADQGISWKESNNGIAAEQVHGLILTPSNNFVASTNLGVFRRKTVDTVWSKTFPTNGYLGGQPLFRDNTGAIYTLGQLLPGSNFTTALPRVTMKSTDEGVTWSPDTLGISILTGVNLPLFFVDETGTQHIATFNNGSTPSRIYAKKPGQAWTGDSSGFSGGESYTVPQAFGSDGRGTLWISTPGQHSPSLLKRPVTGGAWAPDTLGLGKEILNTFAAAKNGIVYAGGFDGVWRRNASGWSRLVTPKLNSLFSIPATAPAYAVSVDSTNALIACYSYIDALGNAIGYGVYSTTDDGANWTNLGHVDTTTFVQFVSYGNVTYGLSYFDGVFVFTTGASGVSEKFFPASLNTLIVFPNPANSEMRISYSISKRSDVVLSVFDILGKEITTITNEMRDSGSYEKVWDVRTVQSGSYIVRLTAGGEVMSKVVEIVR